MHADVDRQLYLYQCSNKSICSLVYFLWLCPCSTECLHSLRTEGEKRRRQRSCSRGDRRRQVPHGIFLLFGLALHVLNTTAGPTLLCTTVQQIPGKYELVSTCTAQTNTGPLFFFSPPPPLVFSCLQHKYLKTTPLFAEWQKESNGGRGAERIEFGENHQ